MKSKPFPLLLAIASLIALTAVIFFAWNNPPESPAPDAPVRLRIGYIPIVDCAQIYVAAQRGYFSRERIDVELVALAGGPAIIQALATGAIDIGFANLATIVFYERTAPRLTRLAGGTRMDKTHSEAGLVVLAESSIKHLSDLRGKSIAVNSRRNIVDLAILRATRLAGLTANEINLIELPFKDMETSLRSKRIHAAPLPEPFLSIALKNGDVRNLGDHFILAFGELYSTGYFSMSNSKTVTAEVARRFDAAILSATQDLSRPNAETLEAISAVTKIPRTVLEKTGWPEFVTNIPESAFRQMETWLTEEQLLKLN